MSHFVIPNHTVVGTNVLGEAAPLLKKMGNKVSMQNSDIKTEYETYN